MKRTLTRVCAVLALSCPAVGAQPNVDPSKLPLPGARQVRVRGLNLAVHCLGVGRPDQPTVVLLSGQGVPAVSWAAAPPPEMQGEVMLHPPFGARQPVQPALAAFTRVCVYDRPGLGSSANLRDASPRTVQNAVDDLHELLGTLSPQGPVVLVGHSMGGLIAYDYALAHPGRVAGLVLVDATHPDERNRLAWLFPPNAENEARAITRGHEHLDSRPATSLGTNAVPAGVLSELPLAVLTRTGGLDAPDARRFGADGSPGMLARWRRDHWAMAAEYASASAAGTLVSANGSGHFIGFDQPELVVTAVRRVLEELKTAPNSTRP